MRSALDWLTEPWSSSIVARSALELVLIGLVCGALGALVTVRGLSFAGEAFAHAVFPGAVAAALLGVPLGLGAVAGAVPAGLVVSTTARRRLPPDTVIGAVLVGSLAAGAVLLSRDRSQGRGIESYLFGTPLGVSDADLVTTAAASALVLGFLLVCWRGLVASTFDPDAAAAAGVPVRILDAGLLTALAVAIVAGVHAVGTLLVVAIVVVPATAARMLARGMAGMALGGAAGGAGAAIGGLYLSYWADAAAGGAVVLVAVGILVLATVARTARARWSAPRASYRQSPQRP